MISCDRCLERKASTVSIHLKKHDGTNHQGREMVKAELTLCEACITELLKAFGRFKKEFVSEGELAD